MGPAGPPGPSNGWTRTGDTITNDNVGGSIDIDGDFTVGGDVGIDGAVLLAAAIEWLSALNGPPSSADPGWRLRTNTFHGLGIDSKAQWYASDDDHDFYYNQVPAGTWHRMFQVTEPGHTRVGVHTPTSATFAPGYGAAVIFSGGSASPMFSSDNSDPLWMARFNSAVNVSELRINLGDDVGNDLLAIGTTPGAEFGLGAFTPRFVFGSDGNAFKAAGGGSWGVLSDGRLKDVKSTFDRGLEAILALEPVRYAYKPSVGAPGEHVGFIAQAVQQVIPEAVTANRDGYLTVNNDPILWTMLNAIQEQQAQIRDLTRANDELRDRVTKLEAAVTRAPTR